MRITKIIATLLLVATMATLLVSCGNRHYDYMANDLTPFLSEAAPDFKKLTVTVDPPVTVSADEAAAFINLIREADAESEVLTEGVMQSGDVMSFRYRVSLDGKNIDGLSNYLSTNPTSVTLGTKGDKFITDREEVFEQAILDAAANLKDYKLVERASGAVGEDKIVYISFVATYKNAEGKSEVYDSESCVRIDLSDEDGAYSDLYETIAAADCGRKVTKEIYIPEKEAIATYEISVHFAVTEEISLDIPVTLPENYDANGDFASLGGKTVVFHLVPLSVTRKDLPELTSDYMKEVLDTICGKKLDGTVTEETFREEIFNTLQEYENYAYEERIYLAIDEEIRAIGDRIVKTYPKLALSEARKENDSYLKLAYDEHVEKNGSSKFPTFLDYKKAILKVNTEEAVEAQINTYAETSVREYIIYYTAAKALGISHTEEEIDAAYNEYLKSAVPSNSTTEEYVKAYDSYFGTGYLKNFVAFTMIKGDVQDVVYKTVTVKHKTTGSAE